MAMIDTWQLQGYMDYRWKIVPYYPRKNL